MIKEVNTHNLKVVVLHIINTLSQLKFKELLDNLEYDEYYNWTPELLENVISNYGFPEESLGEYRISSISDYNEKIISDNIIDHEDGTYSLDFEVPLNGEMSDLTISIEIRKSDNSYKIVLGNIRVM
ncbi:hypothetical protein [Flammeovirga sp. SJP92]|uniref:DUF7668 domain-containing protein n=1 Tax=Flammeovirga sp. SJP92 TaxID=1775430 RepID=UPI0012F81BF1|nr:hypothetical protein [Flammeovirga sp. SJP92]